MSWFLCIHTSGNWDRGGRPLLWPHSYLPTGVGHGATILSVDWWFNASTVVSGGNYRVPGRTRLLFGLNQSSLFMDPKIIRFPILFFLFWDQLTLTSLVSFSRLSLGRTSLWSTTEVWVESSVFGGKISGGLTPAAREPSLEHQGTLMTASQQNAVPHKLWTEGPFSSSRPPPHNAGLELTILRSNLS